MFSKNKKPKCACSFLLRQIVFSCVSKVFGCLCRIWSEAEKQTTPMKSDLTMRMLHVVGAVIAVASLGALVSRVMHSSMRTQIARLRGLVALTRYSRSKQSSVALEDQIVSSAMLCFESLFCGAMKYPLRQGPDLFCELSVSYMDCSSNINSRALASAETCVMKN